jgi:hypothetical protein
MGTRVPDADQTVTNENWRRVFGQLRAELGSDVEDEREAAIEGMRHLLDFRSLTCPVLRLLIESTLADFDAPIPTPPTPECPPPISLSF